MSAIVEQAIYEIKLLADNVADGKHMQMPRTAYRYALEKYDKETRKN